MARSLRDLRRKMKAIKSTRQVTKAMELVAASKMRKAVQNAVQLREYAVAAWNILQRIADQSSESHPSFTERPAKKVLAVLISSDRGLCGSLNTQLFRSATQYIQAMGKTSTLESLEFVGVGRKGQQFLARSGQKVVAAFPAFSNHPTFRDILPLTRFVAESFAAGTYDHVVLLYTDFHTALFQEPTVKVLLPFSRGELKTMLEGLLPRREGRSEMLPPAPKSDSQYIFEPSASEVLGSLVPQLTEIQMYQSILESAASEHSARMVAMRNATENASGILDDLTLTYNQTRQGNITAELAELSASKAALD